MQRAISQRPHVAGLAVAELSCTSGRNDCTWCTTAVLILGMQRFSASPSCLSQTEACFPDTSVLGSLWLQSALYGCCVLHVSVFAAAGCQQPQQV